MKRLIVSTVLLVTAAACGSDDTSPPTAEPAGTEAAAPLDTDVPDEPLVLRIAIDGEKTYIIDEFDNALYLFTTDGTGLTSCTDDCASTWPPLVREVEAGEGVSAALLGTITRPDDAVQVTYNDHPLYYFSGDNPGDINGHGAGDVWFLIEPGGEAAPVAAEAGGRSPGYEP